MSVKMFGLSRDAAVEAGSAEISAAAIVSEIFEVEESDQDEGGIARRPRSLRRTPQSDSSAICTALRVNSQDKESPEQEFGLSSSMELTALQRFIDGTSLRGLQNTNSAVSPSIDRTKNAKRSRFLEPGTAPVSDSSTARRPFVSAFSEDFDDEPGRPVVSKAAVIGYMDETELGHFLIQNNLSVSKKKRGPIISFASPRKCFFWVSEAESFLLLKAEEVVHIIGHEQFIFWGVSCGPLVVCRLNSIQRVLRFRLEKVGASSCGRRCFITPTVVRFRALAYFSF